MSKNTVAKLKLIDLPVKHPGGKAWLCRFVDQKECWIPYACITAWLPDTLEITIQTWMLKQKGLKYKTK